MKKLLLLCVLLLGIVVAGCGYVFVNVYKTASVSDGKSADAIVVLGAAQYDGKPSRVLRARLDHAKALYDKKKGKIIITTGGKRPPDVSTEGGVGKKYLEALGVPAERVLAEEESLTTKQNLMRVAEMSDKLKISSLVLVSDPFHMYRARLIAEDLGLQVYLSPTRTSPISKSEKLQVKYMLREVALVFAHVLFDA